MKRIASPLLKKILATPAHEEECGLLQHSQNLKNKTLETLWGGHKRQIRRTSAGSKSLPPHKNRQQYTLDTELYE